MIQYLSINELTDLTPIMTLWNEENGMIYPISHKMFLGSVVNNENLLRDNSYVVKDGNELVAFILTKAWHEDTIVPLYKEIGWISLVYVKKRYRNQGIGSKLFQLVEEYFKENGKTKIIIGADPYNFFPGLPVDFVNHKRWFKNRGYIVEKEDYDMIRAFEENDAPLPLPEIPYEIRLSTLDDKNRLLRFLNRNFKGRWEYEAMQYYRNGGNGREFVIILDGEEVIAFCRINDRHSPEVLHNINWSSRFKQLGGVGPLGVDREYRKMKLGYCVTAYAINEVQRRGCTHCIIDWTSLVDYYKQFGFEVWKTYYKINKQI